VCGTAYFSALARERGARPVGVDLDPGAARDRAADASRDGLEFPLIEANAEDVPLPDASFDLASPSTAPRSGAIPYKWIPEAARLLRPGGELLFLRNSTISMLCADLDGWHETLQRPQRGLHRLDWEDDNTTEFQLGHGDCSGAARVRASTCSTWSSSTRRTGSNDADYYDSRTPTGREVALGGDLEGAQEVSSHVVQPLLLASTSPQRRVTSTSSAFPYDVLAPTYVEDDRRRPMRSGSCASTRGEGALGRSAGRRSARARRRHRRLARREDLRQAGER
jgi:hypothetical protein